MKNSGMESGMFIDSDEDMEKDLHKDENDGNDSDYSNYSNENNSMRKPSSYSMAWPQSYRLASPVCAHCVLICHE